MKLRSFRLRIVGLSAALAGTALIGFGMISWWLIYEAKISRLDARLEVPIIIAARSESPQYWGRVEGLLSRPWETTTVGLPGVAQVQDSQGNLLYQSAQWPNDLNLESWLRSLPVSSIPDPSIMREADLSDIKVLVKPRFVFITQQVGSQTWRVGAISISERTAAIAINLQATDQEMTLIRNIFMIAIPGVLLLVSLGAWGLSSQALLPIWQLTDIIQSVTAKGLNQRVPAAATDVEFAQLIQVFNQMLERLERSFNQSSRFSADAAHELKTPLAILQGELERTLQQAEAGSPMQQSLGQMLDEVRRLSEIVRKLLLLSLADAGRLRLYAIEVNFTDMIAVMAEDIDLIEPTLKVTTDIEAELRVSGDRELLTRLLQNLISNAVKYNLPNGWIRIQAGKDTTRVWLTISNASVDVPDCDRDRIFDRFHRGDPARNRKIDGTGLGLNLSWEIARAHGGDLTLDPTPMGQTAFTLHLPIRDGLTTNNALT